MRSPLPLVIALVAGCGDLPADPVPAPVDAAPDADLTPILPFPMTITVAATDGEIVVPLALFASGTAEDPLGAISFVADTGTLQHGDTRAGFIYAAVDFGSYTLYQGFAVSESRWDVFWLYCQSANLQYVYAEGISGPRLFRVRATGECTDRFTPTTASVALPPLHFAKPTPLAGYSVVGPDIRVRDGVGEIAIDGQRMPLLVFDGVDCSDCGGGGWDELHAIIWDERNARAIFTIIYLVNRGRVELAYSRSLPDLADPIGNPSLPATWGRSGRRARTAPPGFVLPPPSRRSH